LTLILVLKSRTSRRLAAAGLAVGLLLSPLLRRGTGR